MGKIKRFFSTSLVYFAGNVLSKLIVFFLLPLYTAKISPDQYGTYDLVIAAINLVAPILFVQIWDGMFRASFDYTEEKDKYKIISNSLVVCLGGIVAYTAVFVVVQGFFHMEYAPYIFLYGLFSSLQYQYEYVCRAFLANKLYMASGLVNTLLSAIMNIVLIVGFAWDVRSLYLAPTLGTIAQILIIEFKFKTLGHFRVKNVERDTILQMVKFSVPLCFAAVSYWMLTGFTKLITTVILGAAENGLLAIASRFSSLVVLVITVFQYAWNELAYLMANDEDRTSAYNICVDLLLKFGMLGGAGICILIKILFPYLINEQYAAAIAIIPATIIGSMMNSVASFIGTLFMAERKTSNIMYSTMFAALINVLLGWLCTETFGLHGATVALLISFAFLASARLILSKKQLNVRCSFGTIAWLSVALAATIAEYYAVDSLLADIGTILVIVCIFLLSVRKYLAMLFKGLAGGEA